MCSINREEMSETNKLTVKFFEGEKWLVLTGLLGFLLAGVCAVWVFFNGENVFPDGNISNAFSFNAAMGIFLLSTAAIVPFSAMGVKGRAFFRWSYILLALYSYFAETVQNFRGVDPRFVKSGLPFDNMVGDIFTGVALFLVLCYVFLAIQFFRKKSYMLRPRLVVGIRYAMIAIMISFIAGIWISVNNGRTFGEHGNIIVLHGLGFHALQAIPVVAWLAERTSFSENVRNKRIHLTGITFILGLIVLGYQTYLGHSLFEWSILSLVVFICFLISIATGVQMLRKTCLNILKINCWRELK